MRLSLFQVFASSVYLRLCLKLAGHYSTFLYFSFWQLDGLGSFRCYFYIFFIELRSISNNFIVLEMKKSYHSIFFDKWKNRLIRFVMKCLIYNIQAKRDNNHNTAVNQLFVAHNTQAPSSFTTSYLLKCANVSQQQQNQNKNLCIN